MCTSIPTHAAAAPALIGATPSTRPTGSAQLDRAALHELLCQAPVAAGYRFQLLERSQVRAVVALIARWFPDVSVGSASRYLDESFYQRRVWFADGPPRDVVVVTLRHGDELVGMFSFDVDREAMSIHARIGVAAPQHRGANLAQAGMAFSEAVGRWMGLGMVYGMATLKSPYSQRAFERAGWQLIGIAPGLDREMVEPGVVKRVYEALYVKPLVDAGDMLSPHPGNMTERTLEVFRLLFRSARPPRAVGDAV